MAPRLCTYRLFSPLIAEQNPTDISYVYSGYAPLSVRLAQLLSRPGWRSIEEVLRILPGPHFEERQPLPTGLQKKRKSEAGPGRSLCTVSAAFTCYAVALENTFVRSLGVRVQCSPFVSR